MGNLVTHRTSLALVAFLACIAPSGCNGTATPPPITIGHVGDKSRADKAGDQAELGIRLALSELNKDNALTEAFQGRAVQVRHTDTRGNLDAFASQAVRLDSVNRAVVLLGGSSAREVSALANVKTPIVAFHGSSTEGSNSHVLHLGIRPGAQGNALAMACIQISLSTRVFAIHDERIAESAIIGDAFASKMHASFKERKTKAELITTRFGDKAEWSRINQRLREHMPDLVFFAGEPSDFNLWHADIRSKKTDLSTIIFAASDGDEKRFDLGGAPTSQVFYATAFHAGAESEKVRTFTKSYADAYLETPTVHAALAYDGLRLTIEAMKRAAPLATPERIREELLKPAEIDSVTGPLFVEKSGQVARTIYVVKWHGKRLSLVHTESAKKAE
ncbi:MAG: ABC transporter substrate-binding protein [Gemmataceae bacterium]|nr:ABC transporter substrate-binding protein [Gemmataceae bacterium]